MNKAKIVRFMALFLFFLVAGGLYLLTVYPQDEENIVKGVVTETNYQDKKVAIESYITPEITKIPENESEPSKQLESADIIYVHVCGSVVTPGVYELNSKARVIDAIAKANGFCDGAAQDAINQAQLVIDGQRLYIPSLEEIDAGTFIVNLSVDGNSSEAMEGCINIKTASKQELMTLPGIGESKADSIIAYRKEHNGFQSIEDIQQIAGIKEAIFQKVKDYITVSR